MTLATEPQRRPYAARMPVDERRDQLLDAALDIALEDGFHAVTIDGVARRCAVTRPVVYRLFTSRGELLAALSDRAEGRALAQLAEVFPALPGPRAKVDPDELLVQGIASYLSAIRDDPPTWRVILLPPEGAPEEMRDRVRAHRATMLAQLRALTDWGLPRRRSRGSSPDPELFARAVFTLAEGAGRLLLLDPERWPVERFTDFTRATLTSLR